MRVLSDILDLAFRRNQRRRPASGLSEQSLAERSLAELCQDLLSVRGEVSGQTIAAAILDRYGALDDEGKCGFFDHLATALDIDTDGAMAALASYRADAGTAAWARVMRAAEPRRQELIRRLNQLPRATEALVGMRADLLRLVPGDQASARIDLDFRHLFASWFNRGFLVLRRISWESPAHILEKIIRYEAVHAISSWQELRSRVEPADRRCFAFFHPAMPDEPLIFVEVALTRGIPTSVGAVLAEGRTSLAADDADAAAFYSISNCQAGLAGISFGHSLIKQVVADLSTDLPGLRTFVTLSPIPRLMDWLRDAGENPDDMNEAQLARAAARYLLTAKRGDGQPYDPVARFHLGNGAELHAIRTGADQSARGMAESAGCMVNYLYDRAATAGNHEIYASSRTVVAASAVRDLLLPAGSVSGERNVEPAL